MIRRGRFVLVTVALVAGGAACDGSDVALFTADAALGSNAGTGGGTQDVGPAGGAAGAANPGGDAGPTGTPCRAEQDCPAAWTCAKSDCRAPVGVCQPRPVFCDPNPSPTCGCDHVTYWNDCLRLKYGVPASTSGECGSDATRCDTEADCAAEGATCPHLLPPMARCGPSGPGPSTCWVTPSDCGPSTDRLRWIECSPTGPGSCVSTCEAIRSGRTYAPLPPGAPCPP